MTQPRKGLTDRPILALYAAAQARADDVEAACRSACKGCPGIEHPNGCHTRKWPRAVAGRAQRGVALFVPFRLRVLTPVRLHQEFVLKADEVRDVPGDRLFPLELQPLEALAS